MNDVPDRAQALARRRESLLVLGELQRSVAAARWRELRQPPAWVPLARKGWQFAATHPWAAAAPLGVLLVLRPRWLLRAAGGLATVVRLASLLR